MDMTSDSIETGDEIERKLLSVNEAFVYKVPPLRTASGHRAEDWGLANPLFTGHLRIYQTNTRLRLVLYAYRDTSTLMSTDENLIFFGECPIEVTPGEDVTTYVDAVIDSSRYFVLRLKDPKSTRTTNIGVGFRERETAFDVKNALNEYVRFIDRMAKAEEIHSKSIEEENGTEPTQSASILGDLSLKEGTKIHVTFKKEKSGQADKKFRGTGFIAPPPAGPTVFTSVPISSGSPSSQRSASLHDSTSMHDGDEEFGEFEG